MVLEGHARRVDALRDMGFAIFKTVVDFCHLTEKEIEPDAPSVTLFLFESG